MLQLSFQKGTLEKEKLRLKQLLEIREKALEDLNYKLEEQARELVTRPRK